MKIDYSRQVSLGVGVISPNIKKQLDKDESEVGQWPPWKRACAVLPDIYTAPNGYKY